MESDRKLDLLGAGLAVVIVVSVVLLVAGALWGPSGGEGGVPSTEWSIERANDTHVMLVHDGGEPVPAEELVVTVNGHERPTPFQGVVREGDAGTMQVGPDRTVRVYWTGGSGTHGLLFEGQT